MDRPLRYTHYTYVLITCGAPFGYKRLVLISKGHHSNPATHPINNHGDQRKAAVFESSSAGSSSEDPPAQDHPEAVSANRQTTKELQTKADLHTEDYPEDRVQGEENPQEPRLHRQIGEYVEGGQYIPINPKEGHFLGDLYSMLYDAKYRSS